MCSCCEQKARHVVETSVCVQQRVGAWGLKRATQLSRAAECCESLSRRVGSPNSKPHLTGTRGAFVNTDVGVARLRSWVEACDAHFVTAM